MRKTFAAAIVMAAGFNVATAGEIEGSVVALSTTVSHSTGTTDAASQPVATFIVTLTNTSNSSTLNVARLVASTSVSGGSNGPIATFRTATGADCVATNAAATAIDCSVGSLAVGSPPKTFNVTFSVPTSGTDIAFVWQTLFDNGTPPGNSNGNGGTTPVGLIPIDTSTVTSGIPESVAVTFFTGSGVATPDDPWVTKVKVPSGAVTTTGAVGEFVSSIPCASNLLNCSSSTISIPSGVYGIEGARPLTQFLEITLIRDASTIAKGAKIGSATIEYSGPAAPGDCAGSPCTYPMTVLSCEDTTWGVLPKKGIPCEDRTKRIAYPSKPRPKDAPVPPGFEGDWQFTIYAVDNGKYEQ